MSDNISNVSPDSESNFITGSRKSDTAVFITLLVLLLIGSYFLRVYYSVTVADFNLVYISPECTQQRLSTPTQYKKNFFASESSQLLLESIEQNMRKYIGGSGLFLNYLYKTPGARIILTIDYSYNSTKLDQKKVIMYDEHSSF